MSTDKQTAASRRNGLKSAGPRTTQGKAISRFNAMKHSVFATQQLMFDETADDHAALDAEYHEQYGPANAAECILIETLIANEWRLRRLRRIEAHQWMDASFHFTDSTFDRLQRVVDSCERAYHRALKALQRMQIKVGQALSPANTPANTAANPGPPVPKSRQPQPSKPSSTKLGSLRQIPISPQSPTPNPAKAPGKLIVLPRTRRTPS